MEPGIRGNVPHDSSTVFVLLRVRLSIEGPAVINYHPGPAAAR